MSEIFEYTFYMIHPKNTDKVQIYDETIRDHYIGSTCRPDKRFSQHRSTCNNPDDIHYNLKVYQHIRANGGFEEWQISVLEIHTLTKKDAHIHERWLIELYESALNTQVPSRTHTEYYASHREEKRAHDQAYRSTCREEINAKQRERQAANRESVNAYQRAYRSANREKYTAYQRAYRAAKKALSINI